MDQHEDAKSPPTDQPAPAPIDATPAVPSGLPDAPQLKPVIAGIEAPSIIPSASEPAIDAPAHDAAEPAKVDAAAPMPAASPITRAPARIGRIAQLAAAVVVGLLAGALGATALPPVGALISGTPAPAAEAPSVSAAIAQVRADLAALKTSTETTGRSTSAQLAKLSERFDRIERAQAAGKADMAAAKDATGSTTTSLPPAPSAAPPQPAIVSGWVVRGVYRGNAILQGRLGGMIEVGPGDILPGVGRIESIRREDGRWVVLTAKGMIISMR